MIRPPPETGNIYQVFQRSQQGITPILSGENVNVTGQVEEQVTDVEKPSSPLILPENTTLRTTCERNRTSVASVGQRAFHHSLLHLGLLIRAF